MFSYSGVARLLATRSWVLPAWYTAAAGHLLSASLSACSQCTNSVTFGCTLIGPAAPAATMQDPLRGV
jgi:hypothetical protein